MSHWERKYYVLKTTSASEVIGVVTFLAPSMEANIYYFSLHRPEYENTEAEFLDLNYTEIPYAEYETHLDVFETTEKVEVVTIRETSTNTVILVRKAKKDDVGKGKEVPSS